MVTSTAAERSSDRVATYNLANYTAAVVTSTAAERSSDAVEYGLAEGFGVVTSTAAERSSD